MTAKLITVVTIAFFLISCGGGAGEDLKNLTADYTALEADFKAKESAIKSYKEYQEFMAKKKKALKFSKDQKKVLKSLGKTSFHYKLKNY